MLGFTLEQRVHAITITINRIEEQTMSYPIKAEAGDYIFIDGYERVRKAKLEQDRLKNIDLILPVIERKRPGNAVLN